MVVGDDRRLAHDGGVLQIAVGDGAGGIRLGHEGALDLRGEGETPQVGLAVGVVVDAAHSSLGSIRGAGESGSLGDELGQVGRSAAQTGR
jgi:hypothetical protein